MGVPRGHHAQAILSPVTKIKKMVAFISDIQADQQESLSLRGAHEVDKEAVKGNVDAMVHDRVAHALDTSNGRTGGMHACARSLMRHRAFDAVAAERPA